MGSMNRPAPIVSAAPGDPVARHFGGAARTYDAYATLQLSAARALLALLPDDVRAHRALDLGAGTAPMARRLQTRFPDTRWLGLDLALPMLEEAAERGRLNDLYRGVCADATRLPLADQSLDLIYSSFALQWCRDLAPLAAELTRVSRPGAWFALCVPLPGTLQELRDSWAQADQGQHVNPFHALVAWQAAFADHGWQVETQHQWQVRQHYPDVRAIGTMLRATGAHHVFRDQPAGLTGRRRLLAMVEAYEQQRTMEGLPLTWQIGQLLLRRGE
ncbi:methyltransferase domain-containing protein [Isoalcanivorax indicus]|uniref:methyltransferase domain-containing protein n=1 Tax=Isoalcanivorax indicus TaxID=2202653 RepID=UPI001FE42580|nr:methyltransferase domain-containing protein [Isoalcanivorax indicus]